MPQQRAIIETLATVYPRFVLGLFLFCLATYGAKQDNTIQPVILPVTDASDIRFIRVSFGSFRKEPSYNRVHSIIQDKLGFLWFGTQGKLQRYDGYDIREYPEGPDAPSSVFTYSLFMDRRNIFWGGWDWLDRFDPVKESFKRYTADEFFKAGVVSTTEDRQGVLWFSTTEGLIRMDTETGRMIQYQHNAIDPTSLSSNSVRGAFETKDGQFWAATTNGLDRFDRRTAKVKQHIPLPPDFPAFDPNPVLTTYFLEDHAGALWMTFSYGYGLARVNPESGTLTFYSLDGTGKDNTLQAGARAIVETPDGALWIGTTASGILKLNRERTQFTRYRNNPADPNSLSGDQVHGLFLDREGNMWAGTNGAGVNRFSPRPSPFNVYQHEVGDPNSLDSNYTTSIFEDSRGVLWIGSLSALGQLDRKTRKMTFIRSAGGPGELSSTWIIAMAEDRSGNLWFGTVGAGLNRLDRKTGKFKVFRHDPANPRSLSHDTVRKIFVDHTGAIWVGTEDGLNEFDAKTESFRSYKAGIRPVDSRVHDIVEDAQGMLWLATQSVGLMSFNPKSRQFTLYRHTAEPGSLSDDATTSICIDHTGAIWVATANGLDRFDPVKKTFTAYHERDGLAGDNVASILEGDSGELWVSTNKGLSRFDIKNKIFKNYYVSDGIAGNEFFNYASAFKSRTGEMFFSSYAGVTAFFPRDVVDNRYVPPVVITDLRVSGKSLPIGGNSPLSRSVPFTDSVKLSNNENVISLQFSALSYTNPDGNRYRYRLDGLETAWNESGSDQRVITYSLVPGDYVFHVQGSNSRGIWNEQGTSLQIVILPPWWSTAWFRLFAVSAAFALLVYLYRRRVAVMARQYSMRLEERVGERVRIARELHDTLLQTIQGLMLRLQAVHEMLPPGEAKDELEQTMEIGDQAIIEGRKTVHDLRFPQTQELAQAVRTLGDELARGSNATFRLVVEGPTGKLHPMVRDELFRIGGEALRNAFTHARARQVEAEITFGDQLFRMRIRDDGQGISTEILKEGRSGHFGLAGMRERATQIGAKLTIWSAVGAGTEIDATIPGSIAYAKPAPGQRFTFLRRKARMS